jgi:hypothetical protein
MKIKNIQQYRSFYKNEIRDLPSRDENFIGNFLFDEVNYKKIFGWFEIYHGDKEGYGKAEVGIENFLQSFLDMAKDGQAVYEFLQNAVDSGSTHYTMIWDKDPIDENFYLLVANNGEMFDFNSIRSILNVGSSTKTADSQTIGKFGIGFKLAHRLVGKDNGLQELINENSGPLLFSWQNYELENLANAEEVIPSNIDYEFLPKGKINITDNNPWLFKILITCFPCLPENNYLEELPKMANGIQSTSTPFSKSEYEVLSRWVQKYKTILNRETYKEGALFFIKLGTGKETELAELNLKEGVKFALAILKETAETEVKKNKILHTVQLNEEEAITYPDLQYIKLIVDKEVELDTYAYVRFGLPIYEELTPEQKKKISEEAKIEALFGFRKHDEIAEYFKGAPNLYLYFPLSEEVHNFNYILHSNAFYKGSSRTFLHKGSSKEDGINERLLKTIVKKIDLELNRLSNSTVKTERELFLNFYAALLTSGSSLNQDRKWIEIPFINPIDELLKKYIPVRNSSNSDDFTLITNAGNVFIKKTQIEIDTTAWGLKNVNWFFWGDEAESSIRQAAYSKLGIKDFTAFNLLSINDSISTLLNNWILEDDARIKSVLFEIAVLEVEAMNDPNFKKNFFNLKLLKFNNNELLNIAEFQENEKKGFFIVYNKLNDITDLFQKLEIKYTKENFSENNFSLKYFSFFTNESQVKSYTILTKLFSQVVADEKLLALNKNEKHRIFEAIRTLNDSPGERMGELKLLQNNQNNPVCFKNLYSSSSISLLNKFCINSTEDNTDYKKYLLDKPEELYQGIIYPFWVQILDYIAVNQSKAKEVLDDVVSAYEKSNWQEKSKVLLSTWNRIIFQSKIIESNAIYFNSELEVVSDETYKSIQTTALQYFGVHIPDKYLLSYLDKLPFSFISVVINSKIENIESSIEHISDLLSLSKTCNIDFFSTNCIIEKDGIYYIDSTSGKRQIATAKPTIVNYINTYYPNKYVLIPENLNKYKSKIELSDSKLVEHLINLFDETDFEQELDLVEVVLPERYDDKKALLDKLTFTELDASWIKERQNVLYIKLLRDVADGNLTQEDLAAIHEKISINKDDERIVIGDIDSANDSIEVNSGEKKITLSQSQILNLHNADNIKLIQSFHDEAKKRGLLNQSIADKLFKISNVGISEVLVSKFIENLNEKQLENSHQLLFVWLSGKFKKGEYKEYFLKSHDDEWYNLEKQLIIYSEENAKHIKSSFLLNKSYHGLQSLLQLNDLEALNYNEAEDDIIASRFLFVKGCSTDVLESPEELFSKLNYLYKGWLNLPNFIRVNKRHQAWEKYLNISPNHYVLNGIQIDDEKLASDFIKWCQSDKKKEEFFIAIGVNVGASPIDKIRMYLTGKNSIPPSDIDIEKFNELLLQNTIIGLAGGFTNLNNEPIIYNEIQHQTQLSLIEKIINQVVSSGVQQFPVIIYNTIDSFRILKSEKLSVNKIDETLHLKLRTSVGNNLDLLYNEYNILRQSSLLNQSIIENCNELEFQNTFVSSANHEEHIEPFYHSWQSEHKIKLFRVSELLFDLSIPITGSEIIVGRIQKGYFYIDSSNVEFIGLYYLKNLSLEDLSNYVKEENADLSTKIETLITKRNFMLTSIYNAYNSADKNDISNEHLLALQAAFREEDLKQERKALIDNIKTNEKYSHSWFESYLNYLLTFPNNQDVRRSKTICFQSIKRYVVDDIFSIKYYLLCGASGYVSDSIEDISDFTLSIVLKSNVSTPPIKVEGAQKKGQDLLIYCPAGLNKYILDNIHNIIQLELQFTPKMDLLKELKNAFVNKNYIDEWVEIKNILPNLHFIYGPPGTGKTTSLCKIIIDGVRKKYNTKFLLLTPTNKAADVLCKKLLKKSDSVDDVIKIQLEALTKEGKSISITRYGKPTDPELEKLEGEIYMKALDMQTLDYTNILASTIHRLPYSDIYDKEHDLDYKLFQLEDYWDYIIFDEASMTSLPYLVFSILALHKTNPNAKFIIAGDPKQIPPIVDVNDKDFEELDIQDENVYKMLKINKLKDHKENLRPNDKIDPLYKQFRSVESIGQLFSDLSYDDLLDHARKGKNNLSKPLPEEFLKLISKNVTFIDIPLNREHSLFRIKQLFYSSYHIYSALLVVELIKHLDSLLRENDSFSVGLIAPYKAQAIILNKLITSSGISDKLKIYSDTVHGFQGDECDIVFFISNPNNYYYTGNEKCLLSKEYIYNVAISRARDYLIILHPFEVIKDNKFINSILNSYTKHIEPPVIRNSSEFEEILFSQKDFIEKKSYVTGHDNVNVFGQTDMNYFIKASEYAIDIQLKK